MIKAAFRLSKQATQEETKDFLLRNDVCDPCNPARACSQLMCVACAQVELWKLHVLTVEFSSHDRVSSQGILPWCEGLALCLAR
jgi:hypothetical protein